MIDDNYSRFHNRYVKTNIIITHQYTRKCVSNILTIAFFNQLPNYDVIIVYRVLNW